jgi:serine/threonine protein kinase
VATQDTLVARFICPLCRSIYSEPLVEFCRHDGACLRPFEGHSSRWVGREIADKYRIARLLGSGGAAEVYQAEHIHLGRKVAIKLLHPRHATDPSMMERFKQEARFSAPDCASPTSSSTRAPP